MTRTGIAGQLAQHLAELLAGGEEIRGLLRRREHEVQGTRLRAHEAHGRDHSEEQCAHDYASVHMPRRIVERPRARQANALGCLGGDMVETDVQVFSWDGQVT